MRITLDTNVFVSGLLFGGLPLKILKAALLKQFTLVTTYYSEKEEDFKITVERYRRSDLYRKLTMRAANASRTYNYLAAEFPHIRERLALSTGSLEIVLQDFRRYVATHHYSRSYTAVRDALKDYRGDSLDVNEVTAQFRLARTEIERLALLEHYKKFRWTNIQNDGASKQVRTPVKNPEPMPPGVSDALQMTTLKHLE